MRPPKIKKGELCAINMSYMYEFFTLYLCCFALSNADRIPLGDDDWQISNNQSYSARGQVPGTIHTILLAANLIPEPYLGYNDVNLRSLVYSSWTFKKNFSVTDDFLKFTQFNLHFDQIDTVAKITLNGCPIGQTNSMFIDYTFNVSRSCVKTDNELQIDFESPVIYALNQAKVYNQSVPPDCPPDVQHGECYFQFIRKEPCSFSWNWAPAFAPIGIPGDLYIEGINPSDIIITLDSVNLASYRQSDNHWQVDVLLSSNNDPFQAQLEFALEGTSFTYQTTITINRIVSLSIFIPNDTVQLWWPNGYGTQNLYTFSVSNMGQLFGSRLIGFRTVELVQHDYGPNINGTSFYFVINGHPIYAKGSNWVPPDSFQERISDDRLERLLRSAQLANMNMLRVWGGGIYERDSFYEMADRLGIMLWHDFMFACSLYEVDDAFLENIHNEVIYQVKRLQSHASIVLWSGNNENEQAIAQNWFHIPEERIAKAKDDYRKLYVTTVMKALQEVDKGNNRPFITSSPTNGVESIHEDFVAKNPEDPLYGDVHFYGFYDDSWDPNAYPISRFMSETGAVCLPSLDSWYQITSNISDLDFWSDLVEHRQHYGGGQQLMMHFIESNLPLPVTNDSLKRFTHMIYLSQVNQAMTYKSISDVCRVHSAVDMIDPQTSKGNTMGLLYWMLGEIWQAPSKASIEYGLKWKMSHYYVQHMYELIYPIAILKPYLANVTDVNATVELHVVNEYFNGIQGQLYCSILTLDTFKPRSTFSYNISLTSAGTQHVAKLPYATLMRDSECSTNNQCLIHCSYNDSQHEVGQTLFLTRPKYYQLYQPNLRIQSIQQVSTNDIEITLNATQPALFVWLDVSADLSGYFSHNGFHMFEPTRTVTFHSWAPMTNFNAINFDLRVTSLFDVIQP